MLFALWHGGPSYSLSSIENDDLETFRSIEDAVQALRDRYDSNGTMLCEFNYVGKPSEKILLPAVTTDSTMDLYRYDPREVCDPTPDYRLSFGPRAGVVREKY